MELLVAVTLTPPERDNGSERSTATAPTVETDTPLKSSMLLMWMVNGLTARDKVMVSISEPLVPVTLIK